MIQDLRISVETKNFDAPEDAAQTEIGRPSGKVFVPSRQPAAGKVRADPAPDTPLLAAARYVLGRDCVNAQ